ncbi:ABC transporter substrate-binding protein [Bacteroidia bacterium]|nr:ABC transporter substrate-binding protein [Bacteroidia bacterium]
MAYHNATQVVATPQKIFAVYDGSLLSYSPGDQEKLTYSYNDGLSDVGIKHIAYSSETNALLIVYDNSKMDIFLGKDNVVPLPDINTNAKNYQNTIVNSVFIQGEYAYLSTGYGVTVVNLKKKEIKETYASDLNTLSVCLWGNDIYAATTEGILKVSLSSPNLLDKEYWQFIPPLSMGNYKNIMKMVVFNDQLVFYDGNGVYSLAKDEQVKRLFNGECRQLSIMNEQLVLATYDRVLFYTDFDQYSQLTLDAEYQSIVPAYNSKTNYWIAWGTKGLVEIKAEQQAGTNVLTPSVLASEIKVDSPLRNMTFHLTFEQDKLLVTGGGRRSDRLNNAGTLMVYENGKWYNFDDKAISEKTGLPCQDLMSAVVDPRDPNHYYVSSWGEGIYEFKDNEFVKLYSYENSSLQSANPNYYPERYVRTDGMGFDSDNNLYMVNSEVPKIISILDNSNKWTAQTITVNGTNVIGSMINQLIVTRNNQKWINNASAVNDKNNFNLLALDENNQAYYSRGFVDQQGNDIKAVNYLCLAEDLNGTVWVGTDNGPISFSSIEQMGKGVCDRVIEQDQYGQNDGNGYYLLEGEKITAIAVDGENRKWLGTTGHGIFLVELSGSTLKVDNFTTANSQLLSDNINSIAINNATGEVFIATDKGLCSYMSEAIEGKYDYSDVYAFPNPVYPAHDPQVVITGLMSNSTVKITDMAGNLMNKGFSHGGQYVWNCTNLKGEIAKAGIYLVFAAIADGSQGVVTKIMIIK